MSPMPMRPRTQELDGAAKMTLIGPRVRSLKWYADPPRFYEVHIDEDGNPLLDANKVPLRTGRVIKGKAARRLMEELNEVKSLVRQPDGSTVEVRGKLPPNWMLDEYWEFGLKWLRDVNGRVVMRNGKPIELPRNQRGMFYGRRHAYNGHAERGITVGCTQDLVFVQWWKQRYPDIPYRPITQDYYWYKDDGYITEVLDVDAEVILLGCVGEFMDVTDNDGSLPRPEKPIDLTYIRQ